MLKVKTHIALTPEARTGLKVLAARFNTSPGDMLAALVMLAETLPPLTLAKAVAALDETEGSLVPDGTDLKAYLAEMWASGLVTGEEF